NSKMRLYFLFFAIPVVSLAQSTNAPLNEDYYHLIDRYEVKSGMILPQLFTTIKPYQRSAIISYVDSLGTLGVFSSAADAFNREYLTNDSWEWSSANTNDSRRPFLKHFYKKKSD